MKIHPTAIIHPGAELAEDVEIGPNCIIEEGVRIDSGTILQANVYVARWTEIGKNNQVYPGVIIGHTPQHQKYDGCRTYTKIGDNNIFREYVTIHRSFLPEQSTVIGNNNYIMVMAHIAHDCQIGNNCIIVNGAMLGGHVIVHDGAYISGNVCVHQWVRIGKLALISGLTRVSKDAPPFAIIEGNSYFRGINVIGMRRAGYTQEQRQAVQRAYRLLYFRGLSAAEAIAELEKMNIPEVNAIVDFIRNARRGFCRPKPRRISVDNLNSADEDDESA